MIQVSRLQKSYGGQALFSDVTFSLQKRERVGLLGRNGHGKSTLFRILLGQEVADDGEISIPRGYQLGYLPQTIHFTEATVLEEACLGLPEEDRDASWKAERILTGLGFSDEGMGLSPSSFSGGFQLRINLTKLLLSEPDMLLLDEPTNYLDIVSVRWLRTELQRWKGEMILITHDREFMDTVTTHTMAIHRGKIRKAEGGSRKLQELLVEEEEVYERTRLNEDKRRDEAQAFINRFRAQASKAALVQSRIKELERMGVREELANIASLQFSFTEKGFEAKSLLQAQDMTFGYDASDPLISELSFSIPKDARIGVIGKNGRGKSTLLRLLAGDLTPQEGGIRVHDNTSVGYFGQTNVSRLDAQRTIEQEIHSANPPLSRTQVRAIAGAMMFSGDKAEKKISVLSGGEKSRVLLGKILATPANLLLLDEPTNHLDIESVEALVESLKQFSGGVVIVTHSESILRELCTSLILFRNGTVEYFEGDYDDFLRLRGWDEEEGQDVVPSIERKKEITNEVASNRPGKKGGKGKWQRKKLEEEFESLDKKLQENAAAIEKASLEAKVDELVALSSVRTEMEDRQNFILEELENGSVE